VRVIYASRAASDFLDIITFGIETWGEDASRHYVDNLERSIARLGVYPELGRPSDYAGRRVRQLSTGTHIAYYEIGSDAVTILRILHASQDPKLHIT